MPLLPVLLMVWGTARATAQATPTTASWFVVRWIVASALGGPLLIAAHRTGRHPRRGIGDHRTADAERGARLHERADRARRRRVHRGGFAGQPRPSGRRHCPPGCLIHCGRNQQHAGLLRFVRWRGRLTRCHLGSHPWAVRMTNSIFGQFGLDLVSRSYHPSVIVGTAQSQSDSSASYRGFATFGSFTVFSSNVRRSSPRRAPNPPLGPASVASSSSASSRSQSDGSARDAVADLAERSRS